MDRGLVVGGIAALSAALSMALVPTLGALGLAPAVLAGSVLLVWGLASSKGRG
jgi:hypothetical protein